MSRWNGSKFKCAKIKDSSLSFVVPGTSLTSWKDGCEQCWPNSLLWCKIFLFASAKIRISKLEEGPTGGMESFPKACT